MQAFAKINDKIREGYEAYHPQDLEGCSKRWLDAWQDIKALMADEGIKNLEELQGKYQWAGSLERYLMDLVYDLGNAARSDSKYWQERIRYCRELMELLPDLDPSSIGNARCALAESYDRQGNSAECDRLFEDWVADDPDWGQGFIGWASCCLRDGKNGRENLAKAGSIFKRALAREGLRDRGDVISHALEIFRALEESELVSQLEAETLSSHTSIQKRGVKGDRPEGKVVKIGRNDPCLCGSGKKHKKCCGK